VQAAHAPVETFGLEDVDFDWRAANIVGRDGRTTFDVWHAGEPFGSFVSPLHGEHNVRNALAAIAAGAAAGLDAAEMQQGLEDFAGVSRRLELRGEVRGVAVYDDFAHHPTAILETLRAVRTSFPDRRVWAVFEPRSATSCRRVFQTDFARAFTEAAPDEVIIAHVFRASLPADERLDVDRLVADIRASGRPARALPDVQTIVETIADEAQDRKSTRLNSSHVKIS